ncbi:hypothetical protein DPMN_186902 [Dreissena polymorpha]|uniref:Uncharacterized protein n=1 Tax=Dreissena polymorpha TaxID=45954 RepID=A0A9D4DN10_DREPO|nr:hypothetical protein DPMN_186902 [Dreissena polymorpha]
MQSAEREESNAGLFYGLAGWFAEVVSNPDVSGSFEGKAGVDITRGSQTKQNPCAI